MGNAQQSYMNIIQVILYIMIHNFLWIPVLFHQLNFALQVHIFSLIGSRFHVSKKGCAELSKSLCRLYNHLEDGTLIIHKLYTTVNSVSSALWRYIRLNVKPSLLFSQSKCFTGQIIITYMLNLVKVKVIVSLSDLFIRNKTYNLKRK